MQNGPVDDGITPQRMASSRSRGLDEPHIGKYRLIKTIGKGNFAKVKLAKHVPTGREVISSFVLMLLTLLFRSHMCYNHFICGSNALTFNLIV